MDEDLLTQEESEIRDDEGWVYAIVKVNPETEEVLDVEELQKGRNTHMTIPRVRGIVQHDPQGPTTIEDIDVLNTNEYDEQFGVTANGVCVERFPPYQRIWTPEAEKRNQPFLIDPRTVD